MKFRSDVAGSVTGVRFFKGAGNTGTHVGNLWSASGTLLATATFSDESDVGLAAGDVLVARRDHRGTTYVVSYLAPNGHYAADNDFFASTGLRQRPLARSLDAEGAGNGVYQYGSVSTSRPGATGRRTTGSTSSSPRPDRLRPRRGGRPTGSGA